MKCTVLTVGTEILFGSIVNTNSVFISQQLQELGIDVMYHMSVGDNPVRLKEMLAHAYLDCDMVITTGGLGPTQDDLTKEMICEYFGERNIEFPEEMRKVEAFFEKSGRKMTENNRKQAFFPEHAETLANPNGTAPGFWLNKNGKIIISMPGPPSEMRPMMVNEVRPRLLAMQDAALYSRNIMTYDIGESALETELLEFIDGQTDPTLATYAGTFQCKLRITSKRKTLKEAQAAVDDMTSRVCAKIPNNIYSIDGEELPAVVLRMLKEKGLTLSACESCTGGMFAAAVTDVPGASEVFDRSLVTYTERAKMEELGVSPKTLKEFSAVSARTAEEMAEGLHRASGSDVCVSVTGYAGPTGGTEEDPVGTFYVGLYHDGRCTSQRFTTRRPTRMRVREYAVLQMFLRIYKALK